MTQPPPPEASGRFVLLLGFRFSGVVPALPVAPVIGAFAWLFVQTGGAIPA